jgi:hypothetical protein
VFDLSRNPMGTPQTGAESIKTLMSKIASTTQLIPRGTIISRRVGV